MTFHFHAKFHKYHFHSKDIFLDTYFNQTCIFLCSVRSKENDVVGSIKQSFLQIWLGHSKRRWFIRVFFGIVIINCFRTIFSRDLSSVVKFACRFVDWNETYCEVMEDVRRQALVWLHKGEQFSNFKSENYFEIHRCET